MQPPSGLPAEFVEMWRLDRDAAIVRLWAQEDEAEDSEIAQKKAALEAALSAIENDTSGMEAPPASLPPQPPLEIPKGRAADLLEPQIGTCAALIGNIADYIVRNDTPADVCFPFMDRISSLLSSSATAARVVSQLRGIATEAKQTIVTEKGGKGAGGVPQT